MLWRHRGAQVRGAGCEAVCGTHLRQQRKLHRRQLSNQRGLAVVSSRLVVLRVQGAVKNLLYLGGCGAEKLNVPLAYRLPVPAQCFGSIRLVGEKDERISSSSSIRFLHKQHALVAIQDMAGCRITSGEKVQLGNHIYKITNYIS